MDHRVRRRASNSRRRRIIAQASAADSGRFSAIPWPWSPSFKAYGVAIRLGRSAESPAPWEPMRLQGLKRHIRRITHLSPVSIFGRGTRLGRDSSQSSSAPAIADRPCFAQYATGSRSLNWPPRALWCVPVPNPRTYRRVTRAPPLLPGNGGVRLIGCPSARRRHSSEPESTRSASGCGMAMIL
jgi:hypothetical protein